MYIPEPIIPRGTQELKDRINFKQSTWLKIERKMTYPKYNQNALGRTRKRELMLKIQLINVHNIGMRHLCLSEDYTYLWGKECSSRAHEELKLVIYKAESTETAD